MHVPPAPRRSPRRLPLLDKDDSAPVLLHPQLNVGDSAPCYRRRNHAAIRLVERSTTAVSVVAVSAAAPARVKEMVAGQYESAMSILLLLRRRSNGVAEARSSEYRTAVTGVLFDSHPGGLNVHWLLCWWLRSWCEVAAILR